MCTVSLSQYHLSEYVNKTVSNICRNAAYNGILKVVVIDLEDFFYMRVKIEI